LPPGQLAELLNQLDGRRGASGGARIVPTEQAVAASGVAQTISGNIAASVQQAQAQTQAAGQPLAFNVASAQTNVTPQSTSTLAVDCVTQGTRPPQTVTTTPTQPVTPPLQVGAFSGVLKSGAFPIPDQTSPDNIPVAGGNVTNGTFSAGLGSAGSISFPVTARSMNTFSSTGTSPNGPVSGTSFLTANGTYLYANLSDSNGNSLFVSSGQPVPASTLAPTGTAQVFAFNVSQAPSPPGSNIPFSLNDDTTCTNPTVSPYFIVAPASSAIGAATGPTARTLRASIAFNSNGSGQSSTVVVQTGAIGQLQSGGAPIIGGLIRGVETEIPGVPSGSETIYSHASSLVDANGNSLYGKSTISGFALDQTRITNPSPTSTCCVVTTFSPSSATETEGVSTTPFPETYGFAQPAVAMPVPAGIGASRTTQTLSGFFGGQMFTTATTPNNGTYPIVGVMAVQTDATQNTVFAAFGTNLTPAATGGVSSIGMTSGDPQNATRSAFIDDSHFGAVEGSFQQINGQTLVVNGDSSQAAKLYFVNAGTAPPPTSLLPAGASYCQCQFLQWGYWGGDLLTGDSTDSNISRIDHAHVNFWEAGPLTPQTDLNTLAGQGFTGTYNGHAIGSVYNNGSTYVAAGGFTGTYNFATQNASFSITNFDGLNFSSGTKKVPLAGPFYFANFGGTASGLTGTLNGAFYGPMAAETGGNFTIQSLSTAAPYNAAAIFAARR
jgi:hypothetical protein